MERRFDELTGVALSETFNEDMSALIAKTGKGEFSLIAMDVDMLHAINTDFGREAGDNVFRLIADQIRRLFPEPNIAYRGNRDEFNIVLPKCSKEEAFLKAEQLRRAIFEERLEHYTNDGTQLSQSVSLGVSAYPEDGSRPADISRRADSALMRAKKNGKNMVCLAREEKLIPKTSHYTQAQLERLSVVSEQTEVGEAALLREALDDLLKKYDVDIKKPFGFEDIAEMKRDDLYDLLGEIDLNQLAVALKGASPAVNEAILGSMDAEESEQLKSMMIEMEPRPIKEVEAAQMAIVEKLAVSK